MTNYLDSFLESKSVQYHDNFILISEKVFGDEDNWVDFMEYDYQDGRLWISNNFKKFLHDLFGKSVLDLIPFITKWFEQKFNVEVKYTD